MAERSHLILRTLLTATMTLGLAACGGEGDGDARVVREATLVPGDPIEPTGDTVLAIGSGLDEVALDVATIEQLELLELVVDEPFERREMRVTGVRLRDVVDLAGVPSGVDGVHLHALDDYTADLTIDEAFGDDVILATRVDGQRIPLDNGGPTRLVFTDGSDVGDNDDLWIWSLDRITLR